MTATPDYSRAERFLPWNAEQLVYRLIVDPHWMGDDRFWYRVATRDGEECVLVDLTAGTRTPGFVPPASVESTQAGEGDCTLPCPHRRWVAFTRENNLWVRDIVSGMETALTTDGEPEREFAVPLRSPLLAAGLPETAYGGALDEVFPAAIWSPDGARLLTHQIDARGARQLHLLQSQPGQDGARPALYSYAYPLPGDEIVPRATLFVVSVESGARVQLEIPPLDLLYYGTPLHRSVNKRTSRWVWWSDDGAQVYALTQGRGYQSVELYVADAATGAARLVVEERGETPVSVSQNAFSDPNVWVSQGGREVLWYSQRDGWGHLYLYDGTSGALVRQVTRGDWLVTDLLHVDASARLAWFTACGREPGRDPYQQHLYRVALDGGEPELLTPEDAEHAIVPSPSCRFFVDSYSRLDTPPRTVVRGPNGSVVLDLEMAEIEPLLATGWQAPERFKAKARDGATDVYGVLIRPTDFDPTRRYPVLDSIYGGPQRNQAFTSFADTARGSGGSANFWQAQALAELGFIVVMIDGIGMPGRSKVFHDASYRNLGDGGIPDHVSAIRELGSRYSWIDLDRVGIYGHSAGGYASLRAMLTFPEFYRVCVSSAGNHDHRLDKAVWVERYMGLPVGEHYHEQANQVQAHNLRGNLLLVHGEMDENVHVASTLVVVDALIEANKAFDMLIIPNGTHAISRHPYFLRKRWEYFVRHLG